MFTESSLRAKCSLALKRFRRIDPVWRELVQGNAEGFGQQQHFGIRCASAATGIGWLCSRLAAGDWNEIHLRFGLDRAVLLSLSESLCVGHNLKEKRNDRIKEGHNWR